MPLIVNNGPYKQPKIYDSFCLILIQSADL